MLIAPAAAGSKSKSAGQRVVLLYLASIKLAPLSLAACPRSTNIPNTVAQLKTGGWYAHPPEYYYPAASIACRSTASSASLTWLATEEADHCAAGWANLWDGHNLDVGNGGTLASDAASDGDFVATWCQGVDDLVGEGVSLG